MSSPVKRSYEFGPFRLDPAEHTLWRDGRPVPLRPKAFDILLVLVERHGHLVGKDELLRAVWPDQFVEEGNLNKTVSLLRQALGEAPARHEYIETVPRRGYRFVADVRETGGDSENGPETHSGMGLVAEREVLTADSAGMTGDGGPARPPSANGVAEATEPEPAGLRRPSPPAPASAAARARDSSRAGLRLFLPVLVALTLGTLAYALLMREKETHARPDIASIAVLPLENLSGDLEQEYFADGMTDALIGDLAKIGGLRVISRTSSMHYKGTRKPLPEIAAELKVDAVIEGTVQRSGDRVRVSAQLIRAADDRHLWAETYERDVRDVLGLQGEIARAVAREVHVKITPAEEARLTPGRAVNRKAFDDYLQGRYLYWNRRTEANLHKAVEYFQSAISEDPSYAQAYVGLADCYNALGTVMYSMLPPTEARRRAEEAARKALELDGRLAEAHNALGVLRHFNWDWAAAEQEFKRAIELNPNDAKAHMEYASYLVSRGLADEAIAMSNRARELDPLSLAISAHRGFLLENARRYDEAIEQLRLVIAMDPNHYQANWYLGHTYLAAGRIDEAIAASEKAVALSGRAPGALGILGLVYGLAGRRDDATAVLNELLELSRHRYVTPPALVNVYIGLGDKDQAFVWLEKAYQERSYYMAYLKVFPMVDPLRADPRYDDMLRRVGLAP